jgi:murein DD-endopeptidase MepM/ murein hydrolase activator NlpD
MQSIADRYELDILDLFEYNKLPNFFVNLIPGQRIYLIPDQVSDVAVDNTVINTDFSITSHTVRRGETLFRIAYFYDVSIDNLIAWNHLQSTYVRVGQVLKLNLVDKNQLYRGLKTHTVRRGESLLQIAYSYNVAPENIMRWNDMRSTFINPGQILVLENPANRPVVVTPPPAVVVTPPVETIINTPESTRPVDQTPSTVVQTPSTTARETVTAINPLKSFIRITSEFGRRGISFHRGIDLAANSGTNIYAVLPGEVVLSAYTRDYGNRVVIQHENNIQTVYAHNSSNVVKVGDVVSQGQLIAHVGTTGRSTGNHLHFEYRVRNVPQNPRQLLRGL